MARAVYQANAIHCQGCADSIQRSLGKVPGVNSVKVDIASKRVEVDYDPTQADDTLMRDRLELAGFPAELIEH